MKEIIIKVYKFDELSDVAKKKARDWFRRANDNFQEMEWIQEDAKKIGLKIFFLDWKKNEGIFLETAKETATLIMLNHGKDLSTVKIAMKFLKNLSLLELDENNNYIDEASYEDLVDSFLQTLLEDYRIMLNEEIEYQNSDEQIEENIRANEYDFTEEGKRYAC